MNLNASIESLKYVGSRKAEALAEINITTIADLLEHFPRRYLDRSTVTFTTDLQKDVNATVVGDARVGEATFKLALVIVKLAGASCRLTGDIGY